MKNKGLINLNAIASCIYLIRGKKVMLDRDLALLYGVSTKHLKRQVRRNLNRFPEDFMCELTAEETEKWRCQFGTSKSGDKMGLRYYPFAFTEHGILMLSSVLNSEKASQINIAIMRVFLRLRELIMTHKELAIRVERIDRTVERQGENIKTLCRRVDRYLKIRRRPKRQIGFL